MTTPYLNINSFDNIPITKKTLVLCDIDDTLMYFKDIDRNWWDRQKRECNIFEDDYNSQIDNIMDKWITHIRINEPLFTDKAGFNNMMNKIDKTGSKLIFITARPNRLRHTTLMQLHMLDIDTEKCPVYIIGDTPKGEFVKKNIELNEYKNVVFIDDYIKNIENLNGIFGNKVQCFKFNR